MPTPSATPSPPGHDGGSTSLLHPNAQLVADKAAAAHKAIHPIIQQHGTWLLPVALLALLLFLLLLYRLMRPRPVKSRASLPCFDAEGGNGGTGNALPMAVATAAAGADVTTLREWLSDERCVIDASMADGSTALHMAAKHGHANVLRMLLDAGADALSADAELRTALHLVAVAGHGLCVKALLDAGADPEGRDSDGSTPLEIAERGRHMGCLRMMKLFQERRTSNSTKVSRRAK